MKPEVYAEHKFNYITERYGDEYLKVEEEYRRALAEEYRAMMMFNDWCHDETLIPTARTRPAPKGHDAYEIG